MGGWCHREKSKDITLYIKITLKARSGIVKVSADEWKKIFHQFFCEGRETRDRHFFMNKTSTKWWRKHLSTQVEIYSTFFTVYLWRHHLHAYFSLPSQRIRGSSVDTFIYHTLEDHVFYKCIHTLQFRSVLPGKEYFKKAYYVKKWQKGSLFFYVFLLRNNRIWSPRWEVDDTLIK